MSRRELLATGLISFSAYLLLPSWITFLGSSAEAQAAGCTQTSSGLIPFITVNLQGGAALQANYLPLDQGGQKLANYDRMGLGNSGAAVPVETEFGNVPFAGKKPSSNVLISQFLAGFRSVATEAAANTAFVAVCTRARDDFADNKLAVNGLLAQAGLQGSILPFLGITRRRAGISQAPAVLNPPSPLLVNSFGAITNSIVPAGALDAALSSKQKSSLLSLVSKLSTAQSRSLSNDTSGTAIKQLLSCANVKNEQVKEMIDGGQVIVDPRRDARGAELSTLWNIGAATNGNNQNLVFAGMTYNVLNGNSGAASLEMGGYDYHNNTRTKGDEEDFKAGVTVGRMIQSAHLLGKKLFVYVCTDGAVDSGGDDKASFESVWTSDRGTANVAYILYYDPAGRRATTGFQINHFTDGQVASETSPVGKAEGAAVAVYANYLKLINRMDLYTAGAADVLATQELDKVIKFA